MTKTLQLAQSKFTPKKLPAMVMLSEKLDGVPIRMDFAVTVNSVNLLAASTRQGEHSYSTQFIQQHMAHKLIGVPSGMYSFVGEVTHETLTDFKDVSGVVRRQEPQGGLIYNIFDFVDHAHTDRGFAARIFSAAQLIREQRTDIRFIPQYYVRREDITEWFAKQLRTGAEGGIIRDPYELWQPGKRTWGYQKFVQDPTIDLFIVGVEEATSEAGEPLGMAGRLIASYKGTAIGIGPGKLSHDERRELWAEWKQWQQAIASGYKHTKWKRMAAIKHKRDDSYDALRQPTFQVWRDDKDEADA